MTLKSLALRSRKLHVPAVTVHESQRHGYSRCSWISDIPMLWESSFVATDIAVALLMSLTMVLRCNGRLYRPDINIRSAEAILFVLRLTIDRQTCLVPKGVLTDFFMSNEKHIKHRAHDYELPYLQVYIWYTLSMPVGGKAEQGISKLWKYYQGGWHQSVSIWRTQRERRREAEVWDHNLHL